MNPQQAHNAPLSELRDWCAGDDGWFPIDPADRISHDEWWRWTINGTAGGKTWCMHPYPATIDGAAKAMPEGWYWLRHGAATSHRPDGVLLKWTACQIGAGNWKIVSVPDTGDEIDDRYRLGVLCRIAEKEAKG